MIDVSFSISEGETFGLLGPNGAGKTTFFIGLVAILRQEENALLVYTAAVIGALYMLFLIAELLFPH